MQEDLNLEENKIMEMEIIMIRMEGRGKNQKIRRSVVDLLQLLSTFIK